MVERIFPSWDEINNFHSPLTEGERTLAKFFDDNLPIEWKIFVQPYLNGCRPDIVIFRPNIGVVIFEVKDWNLSLYKWKKNNQVEEHSKKTLDLFVFDGQNYHRIESPIKQVEYYKKKIVEQLVPQIGEAIDNNNRAWGVIKTGLYFHRSDQNKLLEFFGSDSNKYTPIFGADFLTEANLKEIVPDIKLSRSIYWQASWNQEILFWLSPPFHSLEQTTPLKLTNKQKEHAEPAKGRYPMSST